MNEIWFFELMKVIMVCFLYCMLVILLETYEIFSASSVFTLQYDTALLSDCLNHELIYRYIPFFSELIYQTLGAVDYVCSKWRSPKAFFDIEFWLDWCKYICRVTHHPFFTGGSGLLVDWTLMWLSAMDWNPSQPLHVHIVHQHVTKSTVVDH